MFTGIVQGRARVVAVHPATGLKRLVMGFPEDHLDAIQTGASVAVNGVCLTVVERDGNQLHFDVMQTTLETTKTGQLEPGDEVNFERAARMGDEIGGHLLSGHIHVVGHVRRIERTENNLGLFIDIPKNWLRYVFPKGFIAVDGASLTVGQVDDQGFSVHLIPETRRITHFDQLREGSPLNIEIDSQTQTIVDTLGRLGFRPNSSPASEH